MMRILSAAAAAALVLAAGAPRPARAQEASGRPAPVQNLADFKVDCPFPAREVRDSAGNTSLYVEIAQPALKDFTLVETFTLTRREILHKLDPAKATPITDRDREALKADLAPNQHVIINDDIRKLAREIAGEEANPVIAARKFYDWVLNNVEYWVKYPETKKASPVGSTEYCLGTRTGNCTDFHSLWTSLARAHGLPARMVYGSFFKAELDGKDRDQSYHCWPEFYVPGEGWVPHDVAVADIFVGDFETTKANDEKVRLTTADGYKGADKAKVDYYFGSIDERRVTWSRGRDLAMTPSQDAGPVNALAKAYIEIDGKAVGENSGDTVNWTRKLTFTEKK